MEKFADTPVGGIPRRAFDNPRAMESLGSSNLSTQFGGRGEAAFANEARLNGRRLPTLNTAGFVAGKERVRAVVREIDKDIRAINKALPTLDKDGIGFKTLSSRAATLRATNAGLRQQIKNGGYLNTRAGNAQANPNENYYVPKEYADRAGVNTTNSF